MVIEESSSITIVKKEYLCDTNPDSHYEPEHESKPVEEKGLLESLEIIAKHINNDAYLKQYVNYA